MQKEKICLIVPPSIFLLDERVFATLGILKVAAVLEEAGHPVDVIDLSGVANYEDVLGEYLKTTDAKHIGITATTPQMPAVAKIVAKIDELEIQARTIIGGPHPTLVVAASKRELRIDPYNNRGRATVALDQLYEMFGTVVAGDGEDAIFEALKKPGSRTNEGSALVDADDPKGKLFMTNARYEQMPFPARHLVDMESYRYTIEGHKATSLIAQLGCPFACGFCGGRESAMLRRIRNRSTESIIKELEQIHRTYGYTGFMFYDDELNVSKSMVELMDGITDLQMKLGVEFRLRGFVKAELFNEKQAAAMHRAGFRWLLTGFESGAPRILENINKKATLDDNTRCFDLARRAGLKVKALMSIGHPGESEETVNQTKDWLLKMEPDDFDVTIITTYPGSPYYDHAIETAPGIWTYTYEKTGDKLHSYAIDYNEVADYYKGDPNGGYKAYVYTDYLTSDQLVTLRGEVEQSVRGKLGIAFNPGATPTNYEHSMGQSGPLPTNILRSSFPVVIPDKPKVPSLKLKVIQ